MFNSLINRFTPPAQRAWVAPAVLLLGALANSASAQQYTVTDLGSLDGPVSQAFDVNATGDVVGCADGTSTGSQLHGFRWNGSMTDLGLLSGDTQSVAFAINDAGVIVGVSYLLGELHPRAFRWQNGSMSSIGVFTPHDINTGGDVAGTRAIASAKQGLAWIDRACVLVNGTLTTLGTLGGSNSYALGINDAGEVVGSSQIGGDGTSHAFRWNGGGLVDLGTLGGSMSQAYAINNKREIVGTAESADGRAHAFKFLLDVNGKVIQRVTLSDLSAGGGCAYAINDAGVAVGSSNGRAVMWKQTAALDLNSRISSSLGWKLFAATGINASGKIVGYGRHDGVPHAFLLTPTTVVTPWSLSASAGLYTGRTKVTWDAYAGAADYQLQRQQIPGGTYAVIADHLTSLQYNDQDQPKCQKYRYRARARDAGGAFIATSQSAVGWRGTCAALRMMAGPATAAPSPTNERAADLNDDGHVNVQDLISVIGAFGACADGCAEDLDGDGRVDGRDVSLLLLDWD